MLWVLSECSQLLPDRSQMALRPMRMKIGCSRQVWHERTSSSISWAPVGAKKEVNLGPQIPFHHHHVLMDSNDGFHCFGFHCVRIWAVNESGVMTLNVAIYEWSSFLHVTSDKVWILMFTCSLSNIAQVGCSQNMTVVLLWWECSVLTPGL